MPLKKIKETNAIFANVNEAHKRAASDPTILRISIDNKAKVKLGPFDRGGKTRKTIGHDGLQQIRRGADWRRMKKNSDAQSL